MERFLGDRCSVFARRFDGREIELGVYFYAGRGEYPPQLAVYINRAGSITFHASIR